MSVMFYYTVNFVLADDYNTNSKNSFILANDNDLAHLFEVVAPFFTNTSSSIEAHTSSSIEAH